MILIIFIYIQNNLNNTKLKKINIFSIFFDKYMDTLMSYLTILGIEPNTKNIIIVLTN